MSNYKFQVVFDRPDRIYQFNEDVSGKVVLDTEDKLTCRNIWIEYGWRTHGMGDRDKGEIKTLTLLSEEVQYQSGEHREFAFRFNAPNGPVTYHGHILNVDWEVTAHALLDVKFRPNISTKQDFLLIAHEVPEEIVLGNISMSKNELPSRSQGVRITSPIPPDSQFDNWSNSFHLFVAIIFGVLAWIFIFFAFVEPAINLSNYPWLSMVLLFFGVPIIAWGIYSVMSAILNAIQKRNIEVINIQVTPSTLCTGDQVSYNLQFQTKRRAYLESITAALVAEEVVIHEGASGNITHTHVAYEQSYEKPVKEILMAGRLMYFDCVLPVLPGAPATFSAKHNDIKWSIKVRIMFNQLPSWVKTVPITVLPL